MAEEGFDFGAFARPRINPQSAFTMGLVKPYPMVLKPILMPKVWGGRRLERYGKALPPGQNIGESWELSDLGSTSASGAGGGAARSEILNGPLKGQSIDQAMQLWGADLLGDAKPTALGGFPLLVKFLDAEQNLSVQVHPSPAYATAHPGAHLKSESWYILEAAPGAVIYKGLKPGLTRESFEKKVRGSARQAAAVAGWKGTDSMPAASDTVVDDLVAVPAVAGECHHLPSGTLHALGAGVLVAEVQTPSDTTFRVYDWGRIGRELHVEQALACIDFSPAPAATRLDRPQREARLVTTESFTLDERRLRAGKEITLDAGCRAVVVLSGEGTVAGGGVAENLKAGQTVLVPASGGAKFTAAQATTLLIAGLGG